jgi:hypothetical protein
MWRRLRRRTFGPSRPAVFAEQVGLLMVTALVIVGGIVLVVLVLTG